jgi:mitogen-activated protein kinase kinase 3
VRFKNDNFSIGSKGIKQITTGKLISVVNPKDFVKGQQIGIGSSGSVYSATYKPNGMTVAIKSINIYDKSKRKQFKNDLKVLFENNCKHLVTFYGAFFEEGSVKLVLEFMNLGSLDKIISKIKSKTQPCTPENVLRKITKDVKIFKSFIQSDIRRIILSAQKTSNT